MNRFIAIVIFSVLLVCAPSLARACSVEDGYRIPTNFELAKEADAIALVTLPADDGTLPEDVDIDIPMVAKVTHVIKGEFPGDVVNVFGMFAPPRFQGPLFLDDIENAHPLSFIGGCIRYMFPSEAKILVFFKRGEDGALQQIGHPFARIAEDAPSMESRWAKAVKIYADISVLPDDEHQAALIAKRAELLQRGDPDSLAIAEDIGRSLDGPNERWNAQMQRRLYGDPSEE